MAQKKRNKLEKAILFELSVIKVLFVIVVVLNLLFIRKGVVIYNMISLFSVGCVGMGVLGSYGYLGQYIPFVEVGVARFAQWALLFFVYKELLTLNYAIVVIADLVMLLVFSFDKSRFKYQYREE